MSGGFSSRLTLAMFFCFALMLYIAAPILAQGTQSPAQNSNTSPAIQHGGMNTGNVPATKQGTNSGTAAQGRTGSSTTQGRMGTQSNRGTTYRQYPGNSSNEQVSPGSGMNNGDNERQGGASTGAGTPGTGLGTGAGAGTRAGGGATAGAGEQPGTANPK